MQYIGVSNGKKTAASEYRIDDFRPEKIVTDFEKGIINACDAVFPRAPVTCCFFHLKQSLYRKIQKSGLTIRYNDPEDDTIREQTHMMAALAFVPMQQVPRVFRLLHDEVDYELLPLSQYFGKTYVVGRLARGRRKAVDPRYPPALWNQYDAALNGEQKTNNLSEGWHNRFNLVVGKAHPSLYSALTEFQKEQAHSESMVAELSAGKRVSFCEERRITIYSLIYVHK